MIGVMREVHHLFSKIVPMRKELNVHKDIDYIICSGTLVPSYFLMKLWERVEWDVIEMPT
jgi:hypothetical protein